MIIKCKNCQGDNQRGSIFCRSCGAKLDMEYIEKNTKRENILTVNLKYLKLGELKLPEWYNQLFIGDFKPYTSSQKLEALLRKIDEIKIENGQLEIILNR